MLIICADSFYAMTLFFHKLNGRRFDDYWKSDSEAIEFLHRIEKFIQQHVPMPASMISPGRSVLSHRHMQ
jgi:hypothetical protein